MPSITPFRTLFAAATAVVVTASACTGSNNSTDAKCKTVLDYDAAGGASVQSPATGVLTFTGQFYSDETVELGYVDNNTISHTIPITPASDRTSLTFAGLPSGVRTYTVIVSCAAGQESHHNGNFNVK